MKIIKHTIEAIKATSNPRFFNTERGYVGELSHQLQILAKDDPAYPLEAIFEQEVQKRTLKHHGVRQRPDLLIHIPLEAGLSESPRDNNFVVFGFKLNGKQLAVESDFRKLDEMFESLNYETGVFINVGAFPNTFLDGYKSNNLEKIHEFSVGLVDGEVRIRHCYYSDAQFLFADC